MSTYDTRVLVFRTQYYVDEISTLVGLGEGLKRLDELLEDPSTVRLKERLAEFTSLVVELRADVSARLDSDLPQFDNYLDVIKKIHTMITRVTLIARAGGLNCNRSDLVREEHGDAYELTLIGRLVEQLDEILGMLLQFKDYRGKVAC